MGVSERRGWSGEALLSLFTLAGSAAMLWAASYPGGAFFLSAGAAALLLACGITWLVMVVGARSECFRRFWLYVPPALVFVTVPLLVAGVPLQERWERSEDDFARVVQNLKVGRDGVVEVPDRIGSYRITSARAVPHGGVIFKEASGDFLDDAGFAYLPAGPTPDLENGDFEDPHWVPLGGPWYSWTASW